MKLIITAITATLSIVASANYIESTPCRREIMAAALADRVQSSTIDGLDKSTFRVTDFSYLSSKAYPSYDYLVRTLSKDLEDNTTVNVSYAAKITNAKTCAVSVMMIVD